MQKIQLKIFPFSGMPLAITFYLSEYLIFSYNIFGHRLLHLRPIVITFKANSYYS